MTKRTNFKSLYLSRLDLNIRSREVRRDLHNPWEMHRTILRAYEDDTSPPGTGHRNAGRLLFRIEPQRGDSTPKVLVQAEAPADWQRLNKIKPGWFDPENSNPYLQRDDLSDRFFGLSDSPVSFRLRANPVISTPQGPGNRGKRVALLREEELRDWLLRKLTEGEVPAASDVGMRVIPEGWLIFEKGEKKVTLYSVLFEGVFKVSNSQTLAALVREGIGPAKGLGFGLLSLAIA